MLTVVVPRDPRHVYKMRSMIDAVVDRDADGSTSFFEIGRQWGRSIISGLARLDGWPVALFAEDPYVYGGAWTAAASQKVTRLIDLASMFHLPLVHLVDCPGLPHRPAVRAGGHDPPRLDGPGRARREPVAVLLGGDPQGVRGGRRGQRSPAAPLPVCVAVG